MKTIVIGGTGTVGSGVVRGLRALGLEAVTVSRRGSPSGIALDLRDADALQSAARGFDTAFLITPLGPDEGAIGVAAVRALRAAGIGKIVYLSIHNLEPMREIPHFAEKIPIKHEVLAHPDSVVLEANFFFQNDLMAMAAIIHGVYPLPIGSAGVFSVDAEDIARAGVRALTMSAWDGSAVPVCGAERQTGESLAASWSKVLGRPVIYPGDAIAPFIDAMSQAGPGLNDWLRDDFTRMMEVTQLQGCPASPAEIAAAAALIGQAQTRHADFAQRIARS